MYRACHVIYIIITISTTWYLNQSFSVSHTTDSSYWSPYSSRTHLNMAYGYYYLNESDQMTSIPDITIVYDVYYVNWNSM